MVFENIKQVLIFMSHADDVKFEIAETICKLKEKQEDTFALVFSLFEKLF